MSSCYRNVGRGTHKRVIFVEQIVSTKFIRIVSFGPCPIACPVCVKKEVQLKEANIQQIRIESRSEVKSEQRDSVVEGRQ